jgi:hypothetical protein
LADWRKELEDNLKKKTAEKDAIQKLTRAQSIGLNILSSLKSSSSSKANAASGKDLEGALSTIEKEISKLKDDLKILRSVSVLNFLTI